MSSGAPRGGRGRGGKFSKPKRGGGKHFSRDLQPINADGEVENMWTPRTKNVDEESEEDSSEEDDDEDDDDDSDDNKQAENMTREERKAAAKARKNAAIAKKTGHPQPGDLPSDSDDDEENDENLPANPNHSAAAKKQATQVPVADDENEGKKKSTDQLSRREREALQAQQAKERYQKLHAEGKTDEARADMERLKLVRERREAESARKKAEAEERALIEKEKADQLAREDRMRAAAAGRPAKSGKKKK